MHHDKALLDGFLEGLEFFPHLGRNMLACRRAYTPTKRASSSWRHSGLSGRVSPTSRGRGKAVKYFTTLTRSLSSYFEKSLMMWTTLLSSCSNHFFWQPNATKSDLTPTRKARVRAFDQGEGKVTVGEFKRLAIVFEPCHRFGESGFVTDCLIATLV